MYEIFSAVDNIDERLAALDRIEDDDDKKIALHLFSPSQRNETIERKILTHRRYTHRAAKICKKIAESLAESLHKDNLKKEMQQRLSYDERPYFQFNEHTTQQLFVKEYKTIIHYAVHGTERAKIYLSLITLLKEALQRDPTIKRIVFSKKTLLRLMKISKFPDSSLKSYLHGLTKLALPVKRDKKIALCTTASYTKLSNKQVLLECTFSEEVIELIDIISGAIGDISV